MYTRIQKRSRFQSFMCIKYKNKHSSCCIGLNQENLYNNWKKIEIIYPTITVSNLNNQLEGSFVKQPIPYTLYTDSRLR